MVLTLCSQVFLLAFGTKKEHPKELRHKAPFRNAFSERCKRSDKERDERSLHRVTGPCSQSRPFLLPEPKGKPGKTPRNFDMRPDMITQIIQKQFFCVTDVCVIRDN